MRYLYSLVGLVLILVIGVSASTHGSAGTERVGKVEVFVTSWCSYCSKLEAFLKKNKIDYTRYDIESDAKGAEIFKEIGGAGVPVTRVDDQIIHGYDPEQIVQALKARA